MRTKTLDRILKRILIISILVSVSSFCILTYLFFFSRVILPIGLIFMDYTPLGLIWQGWLVVSTNPTLRLTLELLLLLPFTLIFLLTPIGLFTPLSRFNGYETLGEAIEGFKSKIWGIKEGKRTVVFMMTGFAVTCVLGLFILLSGFYVIRHDPALIMALVLFNGITVFINSLIIISYLRIRNQKLQFKQDSVKPKNT